MTQPLKKRFGKKHHWVRLWINLRGLLALSVILAGLVIGLLSLLLPFESLYKERLEHFLEQQWNLAVKVKEIEGSWQGYGPHFDLIDLELTGKQSVQLAAANLSINVYQLMFPGGRTGVDLSISQAELELIQSSDGASISLNDRESEAQYTELVDRILNSGSLRVDDLMFNLVDEFGTEILTGVEADLLLEQDKEYRALSLFIESIDQEHDSNVALDIEKNSTGVIEQSIEIKGRGLKKQALTQDAQWYLKFNQFDLNEFNGLVKDFQLPSGQIDGEVWLEMVDGHLKSLNGQLSWNNPSQDFSFEVLIKQRAEDASLLEHASQLKHASQLISDLSENWHAKIKVHEILVDNQPLNDFEFLIQRKQDSTELKTADVPITWLHKLTQGTGFGAQYKAQLIEFVVGQVSRFESSYDNSNNQWLGGLIEIEALSLKHPKVNLKNLSGLYEFKPGFGQILLESSAGSFAAKEVFRGALNWQQLSAQININTQHEVPVIKVNNLWCACEDFNLQLWAEVNVKDHLQMFLNSRLTAVEVAQLHKYWPYKVWKEEAINWLDQGLLAGQVADAFFTLTGDLIPKGFQQGAAQFTSRAYTQEIVNRFHPDWPVVEGIDSVVDIYHDQVYVELLGAETQGLSILNAQVDINSFESGIVAVDMAASSQNNSLLEYIKNSPLVKNIDVVDNIEIGGQQQINLAFDVAIKPEVNQPFDPQGQVFFNQGQFDTAHFSIANITGPIKLDGYRLLMTDLPAQLGAADVLLNGEILTKSESGVVVDVDLTGSLTTDYLLDLIKQELPISGESDWRINIQNKGQDLTMSAQSFLAGVAIDLPAPLDKLSAENKTLEISCYLPCSESTVEINYNDEIKSTLNSEAGQYHLSRLQFLNAVDDEPVDNEHNELFGGYIKTLNLDQWMKLLSSNQAKPVGNQPDDQNSRTETTSPPGLAPKSTAVDKNITGKNLPVDEIQLHINELIFMSRAFTDIKLDIERLTDAYAIKVKSEAIIGQIVLDDDLESKGIVAEFQRLNWVDAAEHLLQSAAEEAATSAIPDIHLWAEEFSYAGIPLGELRLEVRNVADGINIDRLSLISELAEINISGTWNKAAEDLGLGQSKFHVVMISEKIADFLQTVGFNAPLTNAQTLIDMTAVWDGIPSQFNIANIDGDLEIKIGQGQVLDQKPGFGRVLGLFNLTNLPRRLILDFRDVLADGLLFSSMEGRFKINNGIANTQDFMIKASSAKIHIKGDVGFADQSYDQTITIRPQIGKTFPTIGAIAGGPVGAAAGFLVQGLLGKKLKSSNEIIYHVTGTWDDPVIELIEKAGTDNNDE